jgi:AraC-like DNA-binding protein
MSVRTTLRDPSEFSIPASTIFLLHDAVRPWGVKLQDLLGTSGLDERTVEAPETRISMAQSAALVRRDRELTNEQGLGILIGLLTHPNSFADLSFASQSAGTLGQSIDVTVRYAPILTTAFSLRLNRAQGIAGLVVEEMCDLGDTRDVFLLGILIGLRNVGCELTGREPWRPIDVAMPEPAYYRRFAHLVPELRFDQPVSQIVLLENDLDIPLLTPDRAALRLSAERCEQLLRALGGDTPVEQRILKVVLKEDGPISFDKTAAALGTSTRTLRRRLAKANVMFSELVETARCERALLLMGSQSVSLDEIAEQLGYSNVSNFVRAFRRWTGTTPSAYRREMVGRLTTHLPPRR